MAITLPLTNLTGSEIVLITPTNSTNNPLGAFQQPTTTGAIAALGASASNILKFTALTTVGAGTITAAGIFGKATNRGGTQTIAFTDTTDTAANIIALLPSGEGVNYAFQYTYVNNTTWTATITGGTGVTVSGITVVAPNSWARYIVTYTAANTMTMVGVEFGQFQYVGTFIATGTTPVTVVNANLTATSNVDITLNTVGGTVGAVPAIKTVTPQTGFTVAGTALDTSTYNYVIEG